VHRRARAGALDALRRAVEEDVLSFRARFAQDPWFRAAACVPLLVFAIYLVIAVHTLFVAHPAEDAYILFRYVENFTAGRGIVFNVGGPRAEGATDFLWFALLSVITKIGLNVALAAALLNAIGAGWASFACVEVVRVSTCRGPCTLVLALLSLPVAITGGALAGYFGFSAMLYGALAMWVFHVSLAPTSRRAIWIPMLGLSLGLFRPDGVLIGVAYTLIGFHYARKAGLARPYVKSALAAAAIGALYFACRFLYFGLPLPLPLYVKDNTRAAVDVVTAVMHPQRELSGFDANFVWMESLLGPLPLIGCAVLFLLVARTSWATFRKVALLLVPSLVLLLALCFVHQSQNFAYRFQAPILATVYYLAFWSLVQLHASGRPPIVRVLGCALFVATLWPMIRPAFARMRGAWRNRTYMDTFPALLAPVLKPGRVIALTDAGRAPYWTDARVEDVVGLNTPSAALSPPTIADLEALAPDLVMFNTSNAFDFRALGVQGAPVVRLTREMFETALAPECRAAFDGGPAPSGEFGIREMLAATRLGRLVSDPDAYEAYAVAYGNGYGHVWGFKRGLEELPQILEALEKTTSGGYYRSYLELAEMRSDAAMRAAAAKD
jgi:hypothetical protein